MASFLYCVMKVVVSQQLPVCDALFVFLFKQENKQPRLPYTQLSSDTTRHILHRIEENDFSGDDGDVLTLYLEGDNAKRVVLLGLGNRNDFSFEVFRNAAAQASRVAKKHKAVKVGCLLPDDFEHFDLAEAFMIGFILGSYSFSKFVTQKDRHQFPVETVCFISHCGAKKIIEAAKEGYEEAKSVAYVRDLINTPSSVMTPTTLANEAKRIGRSSPRIRVKVFNEKKLKRMGMNLLYAVGAASTEPTTFTVLEYKYKPKNKKPIAIVGKGITFDTGGMHLKPSPYIEDMKMDMAGGAIVLGLFQMLAKKRVPVHVVGFIPAAENEIGGGAYKPGDIITAYNKKTVEITNTDAEGRLVLADALSYCVKHYKPEAIIDIATLTGVCIMALGYEITAMISNNHKLMDKLKQSSFETQEPLWELPFHQNYVKKVKSDIADLKNFTSGVHAGTIMGGAFLSEFIDKTPWAHLDIAGTAWCREASGYKVLGATGAMVRLLWNFLRKY